MADQEHQDKFMRDESPQDLVSSPLLRYKNKKNKLLDKKLKKLKETTLREYQTHKRNGMVVYIKVRFGEAVNRYKSDKQI